MEYKYKLDDVRIAKKIRAARKQAHLTQAELAEKINISTNAIAKLETNLMNISLQTLINIANVLEMDINYLLLDGKEKCQEENLDDLIQTLSMRDKAFLVHIINGLKEYHEGDQD